MGGASNSKEARVGLVLMTSDGTIIEQSYTLSFLATNNEAEYEALIAELKMVDALRVRWLKVSCDSLLVVNQVNDEFLTRDEQMAAYLRVVLA